MRKNELRRFANNQLRLDNTGSHRDKQHRAFVIKKIINDLFKIGQCPSHWYALNQTHVQTLVQLWKKQGIITVTRENMLWLTRDITFNHQDRAVPIRSEAQLSILVSFRLIIQSNESMLDTHGCYAILHTYQRTMKLARLPQKQTYRYLYAQHQYEELSKTLSHKKTCQTIMNEMGLKSRATLWNYLK